MTTVLVDFFKMQTVREIMQSEKKIAATKKRFALVNYIVVLGMFTASLIGRFEETLSRSATTLVMDRSKVDPVVDSGPFITALNDIISNLIYFLYSDSVHELFNIEKNTPYEECRDKSTCYGCTTYNGLTIEI